MLDIVRQGASRLQVGEFDYCLGIAGIGQWMFDTQMGEGAVHG